MRVLLIGSQLPFPSSFSFLLSMFAEFCALEKNRSDVLIQSSLPKGIIGRGIQSALFGAVRILSFSVRAKRRSWLSFQGEGRNRVG